VDELIKQKRREHEMERNGGLEVAAALDDKRTAKIGEMVA
jgi:Mg-chelatase subunit ChlI